MEDLLPTIIMPLRTHTQNPMRRIIGQSKNVWISFRCLGMDTMRTVHFSSSPQTRCLDLFLWRHDTLIGKYQKSTSGHFHFEGVQDNFWRKALVIGIPIQTCYPRPQGFNGFYRYTVLFQYGTSFFTNVWNQDTALLVIATSRICVARKGRSCSFGCGRGSRKRSSTHDGQEENVVDAVVGGAS